MVDYSVRDRNKEALMPGPPPEHPHLRLLKGNPGKSPGTLIARGSARGRVSRTAEASEPRKRNDEPLSPELHRLNLLTILDIGPLADRTKL